MMTLKQLVNRVANWIKVSAIWLTDLCNWLIDPFQEFTRPEQAKYFEYLHEKAAKFEGNLKDFFWLRHCVYHYNLPGNSGDQALWHGVATAMWALKYSVTGHQDDLERLTLCAYGLSAHQNPEPDGPPRLIRGWRDQVTLEFEDGASNDQATGHLLGIYFLWKYGSVGCREAARALITGLADELAIYDNKLINADKSPTKHGKLENGLLTDPLNLTLCLAVYRVAYAITHEPLYLARYERLVKEYRPLLPYANVSLLWWKKTHHAHRAAIHYSILCDLEADTRLHMKYVAGLLRTWRMERKSANPWIYYLVRRVCSVDRAFEDRARTHLREFTLEDKQRNAERINSDKVATFKWGKHRRVRQPLPRWRAGSQDFFWQRDLHSADDWVGNNGGNIRHNGVDYLVAYWGLRSIRVIGRTE